MEIRELTKSVGEYFGFSNNVHEITYSIQNESNINTSLNEINNNVNNVNRVVNETNRIVNDTYSYVAENIK